MSWNSFKKGWNNFWNEAWDQITHPKFGMDYAMNPKSMLDDLGIEYDDSNSFSLSDPLGIGKGFSEATNAVGNTLNELTNSGGTINQIFNTVPDLLGELPNTIKDFLGVTQREHLNRADELAEQTQRFNEQYSMQALSEQAQQFELNYLQANKNIDFQKDIAEKNLAMQQDVFNAQLAENELTRQREDNAYQRQVADLKAAGFSPLMASNGAGAAAMSVGSAPQYDAAAVSTAQGSAINMAREYAALRNMAQGQYLTRKQEAANQRIGALMALSDLGAQRQNLALTTFNLANNIKDSRKRREQIDEQIRVSKNTNRWMENNGYRNRDIWNTLYPIFEKLADKLGFSVDNLEKLVPSVTINNYSQLYDGTDSSFNELKSKTQVLNNASITKNSFDDLMSQLVEPSEVSSEQVHDWYTSMNKEFQDKFSYGYFYDAVTNKSKFKRSVLTKYLMFGNSGNL